MGPRHPQARPRARRTLSPRAASLDSPAVPANPPSPMRRPPLDGVLVADFSRILAGPFAAMTLGDLGAEVIKVERPSGDDTRSWGPPWAPDGTSTYYQAVNRNKRSIVLDLGDERDRELAARLIERSDVLIENFRPGTLERFGLGEETTRAANPRLVSCSLTGFGSGAGAALPGYDLMVQAVGGLMSVTGQPQGPPTKVGVALVDVIAGLFATVAILAALIKAGRPTSIDLLHQDLGSKSCDIVTVYRCMAAFESIGLVRRAFLINGTSLYEINLGNPNRYHVVCKQTNAV